MLFFLITALVCCQTLAADQTVSSAALNSILCSAADSLEVFENSIFGEFNHILKMEEQEKNELSEIIAYIRDMNQQQPDALSLAKQEKLFQYLCRLDLELKSSLALKGDNRLNCYKRIGSIVKHIVDEIMLADG